MIDLLFTIDRRFFIKLRSSLIDQIYILTMKKDKFHDVKGCIGPYTYEWILRFRLRSSDLEIYPYMYGENFEIAKAGEGRITRAKKKSITGKWKDRPYMIENLLSDRKIDF